MNKQTQRLELTLKQDVINGFSYSFTKSLLEKLKKLKEEDRIFIGGWEKAIEEEKQHKKNHLNIDLNKTKIAKLVISYLVKQILGEELPEIGDSKDPSDVDSLIEVCEDFLLTFSSEKK